MHHDFMYYNEKDHSSFVSPSNTSGPYNADGGEAHTAQAQVEAMMFMILDGYSIADARFGVFKNYPQHGGGGHTSHMVVMPPKCAPFAPRVDEENSNFNVVDYNFIEIILDSPGLIDSMDGFIASTINNDTVKLFDDDENLIDPVDYSVTYNPDNKKITLRGHFIKPSYSLMLKCGNDGIKNIKGAPMLNTREDEFRDDISYSFTNQIQGETNPPSTPTGLNAVVNPDSIDFDWNDSTDDSGIHHYKIVVSDSPSFENIVFSSNPADSSISATVWAYGVTNYWRVLAQDTEGNISAWSEVKSFEGPLDTIPPSIPSDITVVINAKTIDFDWSDSTDASGYIENYEILISDSSSFDNVVFSASPAESNVSTTSWVYDATNYFKIRALDKAGNVSDWSEVQIFTGPSDTTPPSVPTDFTYSILRVPSS